MTPHPGVFIKERLEAEGITQKQFAEIVHMSPQYINDVLKGRRSISVNLAIQLERRFGRRALMWLTWQAQYDLSMAECPPLKVSV